MSANNGGNPRLDRIERMLEGLTKSHAKHDREIAESRAAFDRAMAKSREEFDRRMAESDERFERKIAASDAKSERDSRRFRDDLRRWAAMYVKDDRARRKRHRKIEGYLTRLAAAQRVTAESLEDLIASM